MKPAPAANPDGQPEGVTALEAATIRQISIRIVPFLIVCYFFAFISRTNAGLAALQMNQDVGLAPAAFGFGGSLFFVSYTLCGIPGNLAMVRVGARLWLGLMIVALSLTSLAMALVEGANSFYAVRFLLGAVEAGFFPGAVLYLTYWFPRAYRARIIAAFMVAIPLSSFLGSPLSAALLGLEGRGGLHGWQWMFLLEALPIVLLGAMAFFLLPDSPASARWLRPDQVRWLAGRLAAEKKVSIQRVPLWKVLLDGRVLLLSLGYAAASAASNSLSLWQPQIIQSFGLTNAQTGLLNAVPFGLGLVAMIVWGRHSDRTGERLLSTALPLLLCAISLSLTLVTNSLPATVVILCLALIGTYAIKGPFWALAADWMSTETAPTGIAAINTLAHVATFGAIYLIGAIKSSTGSYPLALLPLVVLGIAGASGLLLMGRRKEA
ncbi:MFS transporter [Opitutus sp. GAS368]|jgi:ACS family tartrate transporter-like MFS transporter|uniref:MFS transporter n=1 Tax=Opitutus sp. GAS368 TaxID=1882749 RepID=UPI00087DB257|nr:MFS transporter [Opitutus sp. GAS368]SDR66739.1 Sugar phosphate permease [Opitutus sp. GAS368]